MLIKIICIKLYSIFNDLSPKSANKGKQFGLPPALAWSFSSGQAAFFAKLYALNCRKYK